VLGLYVLAAPITDAKRLAVSLHVSSVVISISSRAATANRRLLVRALQRSFPAAHVAEAADGAEAVAYVMRYQPGGEPTPAAQATTALPGSGVTSCVERPGAFTALAASPPLVLGSGASLPTPQRRPVDLIVMDHEMPVLNGSAATARLRQLGVTCAIVGATGNAFGRDKDAFRASGLDEVFTKPINVNELAAWVRSRVRTSVAADGRLTVPPAGDEVATPALADSSATMTMMMAASGQTAAGSDATHPTLLVHPAPHFVNLL
jgi:CheY-like chemotaxis protein